MTTIEKLFEQIFDRKRLIVDRAKQQADSYAHHLASKLLVAGLTPPPSLWRKPNLASKEFKKEELLSQLLLPHPKPTVNNILLETNRPAFVSRIYDSEIGNALNAPDENVSALSLPGKIAVMGSGKIAEPANKETLEVSSFEFNISKSGFNVEDMSTPFPEFNNNDVGCLLSSASKLDHRIISPQGENETRNFSDFSARDQSLSRIQRSKSRQKALEIRKTVAKADKIHQNDTNSSIVCCNGEKLFSNNSKQCQPQMDDESLGLDIYSGSMSHRNTEVQAKQELSSKEKDTNPYCGRTTRSRSSCSVATNENKSIFGKSLGISDIDGGKTIRSLDNFVKEIIKPVQILNASSLRVTRSKSGASGKSSLNILNDQKECPGKNGSISKLNLCCPDTFDIINQKEKTDFLIKTEVILNGPDKVDAACLESVLEDFDSRPSSKGRMTVKPKILDFEEMEKSTLIEEIRPMVKNKILDKSLEKRRELGNSPRKTISNLSGKTSEKRSVREEMDQKSEILGNYYELCLEEHVEDDEHVIVSRASNNFKDNFDAVENIKNSHVLHVEETRSLNATEGVDMEETSYIPNQQVEKGEPCDAVDSPFSEGEIFKSDEIRFLEQTLTQGRNLRPTAVNTWPQNKRRKIESQDTKLSSSATSFKMKESHNIGGSSNNRFLNNIGPKLKTTLRVEDSPCSHEENAIKSDVSKSPDVEMHRNILTQGTYLLPGMSIEQDEVDFGEKTHHKIFSLSDKDREYVSFAASSLSNKKDENSENSSILNFRTANANSTVLDLNTHKSEKNEQMGTSASDQTMPEFNSSIIGEEYCENMHRVGDAFNGLDLPMNNVERASLLEQLCKSAVTQTPVIQFSTKNKFYRTPDVYQFVPNGVLEHFEPKSTLSSSNNGYKELRASYSSVNKFNGTYNGLCPDRVPFSDIYYGRDLKVPPTSPVWGTISSKSISSEKNRSSNPELICFPIEEDPSISEELENKSEVANSTQEVICSASIDSGDKRIPLADINQNNINIKPSKKSRDRSRLDSVNTEVSCTGTHGGGKNKLAKRHSSKRVGKNEANKKLTLSTSTNLNNRFSKPNLSRKTSLRNGGQRISVRDSKNNNIISNISSFVPLVQQKQAAALVTGKRDVKVKALEAAEAARRLEEKKDNERKLKKEALKLERARMEQENLLQAKLKKKKKEDDLKKREADVAARKRLREEEEKNERERKRMFFEGKRQQLREQEEKLRSRKEEKDLLIEAKLNSGKVTSDALRKPQKVKGDVNKGKGNNVQKPDKEGLEAFDHFRVSTAVTNTSREKSYNISPYQSSDDEDDEEDEISPKKFVPTWASKKSLALVVSLQKDVEPYILFPLKSFCSVNEASGLEVYKKK